MMLIICDKSPDKAVGWLVEYTNKNFVFKQLLELGQLVSSVGISDVYKKINQGKSLQEFCKKHIEWIYYFYEYLYLWCKDNVKMQQRTKTRMQEIRADLFCNCKIEAIKRKIMNSGHRIGFDIEIRPIKYDLDTAIFRYKNGYECEYSSNSELDIDLCCSLYRDYIKNFKFRKDEV